MSIECKHGYLARTCDQCEADAEIARLTRELEEARRERDNWMEAAAQFSRNQDYYRGLVVAIGKQIGEEAYVCDDGAISEDVLCAKVPECERLQHDVSRQATALSDANTEC